MQKTNSLKMLTLILMLSFPSTPTAFLDMLPPDLPPAGIEATWPNLYNVHCLRTCVDGQLVIEQPPDTQRPCTNPPCFPCECGHDCQLKGTCCPSAQLFTANYSTLEKTTNPKEDASVYDAFKRAVCVLFSLHGEYLVVRECPIKWENPIVRSKCEEYYLEEYKTMDMKVPYTDTNTRLTFVNIYCALCNGYDVNEKIPDERFHVEGGFDASFMQGWPIGISCDGFYNELFHFTDRHKMAELMITVGLDSEGMLSHCRAEFFDTHNAYACENYRLDESQYLPEDQCPEDADEELTQLCLNLPDILSLKVTHSKNIFCHLCNNKPLSSDRFCYYDGTSPDYDLVVYFDPNTDTRVEKTHCWPNKWLDTKDGCVSIICSPGKLVLGDDDDDKDDDDDDDDDEDDAGDGDDDEDSGGNGDADWSCATAIKEISAFSYIFHIVFVPLEPVPDHLFVKIGPFLDGLTNGNNTDPFYNDYDYPSEYSFTTTECHSNDGTEEYKQEIMYKFEFLQHWTPMRDVFEKEFLDAVTQSNFSVTVEDAVSNVKMNIPLRAVCVGWEFCEVYLMLSRYQNCIERNRSLAGNNGHWLRGPDDGMEIKIDMVPSLVCPYITPTLATEPFLQDKQVVFSIQLKDRVVSVTDISKISIRDGQFQLCVSLLQNIVREFEAHNTLSVVDVGNDSNSNSNAKDVIAYIKSHIHPVLSVVSCLFLTVSIATISLKPSLRTVSRLNTLCLCVVLAISQVSTLLAILMIEFLEIASDIHCLVHGVVLHYSWIASFTWINACCIHARRVLTCHGATFTKKHLLWYSIYSLGSPLIVVAIVITMATIMTGGASIGYDSDTCFLDTNTSNVIPTVGLLTPLAFCLVVNGVGLFLMVRNKAWIGSQNRNQGRDADSDDGVSFRSTIVVTLSTLSSTMCFVATAVVMVMVETRNSLVLTFVFGLFSAVQSLVIFSGLISDKQVIKIFTKTIFKPLKTRGIVESKTNNN